MRSIYTRHHTYTYIYIYLYIYTQRCRHICICTYKYVCIHIYTYIYTHVHICTSICLHNMHISRYRSAFTHLPTPIAISVSLSPYLPTYLPIYQSICLSIHKSTNHTHIYVYMYIGVHMSYIHIVCGSFIPLHFLGHREQLPWHGHQGRPDIPSCRSMPRPTVASPVTTTAISFVGCLPFKT